MKEGFYNNWHRAWLTFSIILCASLVERPVAAQVPYLGPQQGMILENGVLKAPTPESAMRKLMDSTDFLGPETSLEIEYALVAVLLQIFEPRSRAELDAFAAELGRIFAEERGWPGSYAGVALRAAGRSDVFIRIYESIEDYPRLDDPSAILNAVKGSGGLDYVRQIFADSEKPPPCSSDPPPLPDLNWNWCPNVGPWCDAGGNLVGLPGGPTMEEWEALCRSAGDIVILFD